MQTTNGSSLHVLTLTVFFFSMKISGVWGFIFVPLPQQNQTIPQVSMQAWLYASVFGLTGITLEHLIMFKMEFTSC